MRVLILLMIFSLGISVSSAMAQTAGNVQILIENVRVFNGKSSAVSQPLNVLIAGNAISKISASPIPVSEPVYKINGTGKTLMPGLIDVHVHLVFGSLTMDEMQSPELSEKLIVEKAAIATEKMLMRGFTSVRDVGGPIFPLKAAIDDGKISGPRIWPSGATISQTAGHGDFRAPAEKSRRFF